MAKPTHEPHGNRPQSGAENDAAAPRRESDDALGERVADGDHAAFTELFLAQYGRVR